MGFRETWALDKIHTAELAFWLALEPELLTTVNVSLQLCVVLFNRTDRHGGMELM